MVIEKKAKTASWARARQSLTSRAAQGSGRARAGEEAALLSAAKITDRNDDYAGDEGKDGTGEEKCPLIGIGA